MHQNGINITTFGIGGDFDEVVMKGIAEYGSGDYFFIRTPEDILTQVSKGLKLIVRRFTGLLSINENSKIYWELTLSFHFKD